MYTRNTEVSGNTSIGNHLGFAIMFSDRAKAMPSSPTASR
jgi:nitrous oxidase accessory protein